MSLAHGAKNVHRFEGFYNPIDNSARLKPNSRVDPETDNNLRNRYKINNNDQYKYRFELDINKNKLNDYVDIKLSIQI